jgi:ribose 5-phosphate isomerase B
MLKTVDKNIILASDHNGVKLKCKLKSILREGGYNPIDLGPFKSENVDYVDYANQLSTIIHNKEIERGILICGTGVGMSIAANRFKNVRAALIHNLDSASKSREHNNSNVLCLGSWISSTQNAKEILEKWLDTPFGEGRHVKRIEKITDHKPKTVVFTNGIFDLLHKGHLEVLNFSKSLGDRLVVGINSDRATRELKGLGRPVNSEEDRKKILSSLSVVDEVIIFDHTDTKEIIEQINPDIVVKGGEFTASEVRARDEIPDHIDIKVAPLLDKGQYSTTKVIEKVRGNARS